MYSYIVVLLFFLNTINLSGSTACSTIGVEYNVLRVSECQVVVVTQNDLTRLPYQDTLFKIANYTCMKRVNRRRMRLLAKWRSRLKKLYCTVVVFFAFCSPFLPTHVLSLRALWSIQLRNELYVGVSLIK